MPWWATLLACVFSALGGVGASRWVTIFAERKKINADTTSEVITIYSSVLKDVHTSYTNLNDELVQVRMECLAFQQQVDDLQKEVQECRVAAIMNREALKEQSRLVSVELEKTWLARRQAHLADNTLGNYELHIEFLLEEMRKNKVTIIPIMRPQRIRAAYQAEKEKLEALESKLTDGMFKKEPTPEGIDQNPPENIDE